MCNGFTYQSSVGRPCYGRNPWRSRYLNSYPSSQLVVCSGCLWKIIGRLLKHQQIPVLYKPQKNINSTFPQPKQQDKIDRPSSGIEYKINCRQCDFVYYGQTKITEDAGVWAQKGCFDVQVIYQKRVRVFHQGFQTPRNRWKHEAAGRVLLLFRGVWNPWWNTKHEFLV